MDRDTSLQSILLVLRERVSTLVKGDPANLGRRPVKNVYHNIITIFETIV
jgi:hypothetical protein